ncbi:MAG: hypothetical protein AB7S26_31115 [Sandaracinaceae bacterium]
MNRTRRGRMARVGALVAPWVLAACGTVGVDPTDAGPDARSSSPDAAAQGQTLVVRFVGDEEIAAVADRLVVDVTLDGETTRTVFPFRAGEPMATELPVTMTFSLASASRVEIVADVLDSAREVAARRRASGPATAGELTLRFDASCLSMLCEEGTSCESGACVPACFAADLDRTECDAPPPPQLPTDCADHASARLCDGFEAPLPGPFTSLEVADPATLAIESMPHRGASALAARTTASGRVSAYARARIASPTEGELYVRLWAYVPGDAVLDRVNFVYAGAADPSGFFGIVLGVDGPDAFAGWVPDEDPGARAPFPRDTWVCLVAHAGGAGVDLEVDGAAVHHARDGIAFPTTEIDVNVGVALAPSASGPIAIHVDDLLVDVEPLRCAP